MDRINNIFKSEIEFKKNLVRIIKKYYEQPYTNKFDNLEEMGNFLKTFSLLKLNQEEKKNSKS